MAWPKGMKRDPKTGKAIPAQPEPPKRSADAVDWNAIAEERSQVLRRDRDEPESRKEGEIRGDHPLRAEALPDDDLERYLDIAALESKLPSPPPMPGWHQFWASTTNQQTPIQMYVRLGYVFVHPDEIPAWRHMKAQSAQFSCEVLQCNEMILMKLPEDRYQRIMKHVHHDKPMSEAERLLVNLELLKQEVGQDSKGRSLVREEGDGLASLVDRRLRSSRFE